MFLNYLITRFKRHIHSATRDWNFESFCVCLFSQRVLTELNYLQLNSFLYFGESPSETSGLFLFGDRIRNYFYLFFCLHQKFRLLQNGHDFKVIPQWKTEGTLFYWTSKGRKQGAFNFPLRDHLKKQFSLCKLELCNFNQNCQSNINLPNEKFRALYLKKVSNFHETQNL